MGTGWVLTAVDLVGLLVGDLNAELLLYRHDDLDGVQAVQAEVVAEVGGGLDLSDEHTGQSNTFKHKAWCSRVE